MGTFRNWGTLDSKALELSLHTINIAVRFVSFQALQLSTSNLCHCTGCYGTNATRSYGSALMGNRLPHQQNISQERGPPCL